MKTEVAIMPRKKYTAEFKAKCVVCLLLGVLVLFVIWSVSGLIPYLFRKWKQDFLQHAHRAFSADSENKAAQRKEEDLKKKNDQMLKTIGQLTLERDFLQGCFRQAGAPLPDIPEYDSKG